MPDRRGPWTERVLRLIGEREAVRAGDLADELGMERLAFKTDVRKLKALGLTESLGTGLPAVATRPGLARPVTACRCRSGVSACCAGGRGGGPSCGSCRAAS